MSVKNIEVILGTYEEFLLGYKVTEVNEKLELTQTFATHEHTGSIKCVATSKRFMATGATDDRIFIYDLYTRKVHTVLTHHSGTVNSLVFSPDNTHLLSGSEDGSLAVIRVGNWQLEKLWTKSHSGKPVRLLSCHPSGKLALSVGTDGTLRTWNLVKGRQAFVIRLSPDMQQVQNLLWILDGQKFILTAGRFIELWDISKGGCEIHIEQSASVVSACWTNSHLLVGLENGCLNILGIDLLEITSNCKHKSRIRCIVGFENQIVSADSSGTIIVWSFVDNALVVLASISAGCRITCAILSVSQCITKTESDKSSEQVSLKRKESQGHKKLKQNKTTVKVIVTDEDYSKKNEPSEKVVKKKLKTNKFKKKKSI